MECNGCGAHYLQNRSPGCTGSYSENKRRFRKENGMTEKEENPLNVQVGGGHYKDMPIQPIEFIHKNGLNFCQGNIIKYVTRYKSKNGIEDLKKAKHYIDLLIELEYGNIHEN